MRMWLPVRFSDFMVTASIFALVLAILTQTLLRNRESSQFTKDVILFVIPTLIMLVVSSILSNAIGDPTWKRILYLIGFQTAAVILGLLSVSWIYGF